ncbi:MAG: insulinase family protein, partial [Magnetococcales bacterium]|nr:insulinase family protein [Magnetococcales bacterium]
MKKWIVLWMTWWLWTMPFLAVEAAAPAEARFFLTKHGIQVYLVENHANPMVEMHLLTRGGSVFDPVGKGGTAFMTAWMFNEGAADMDSTAFRDRLDYYGIVMNGDAKRDTLDVSLTTLSKHLEEAMRLLGLALTQPRFDAKDFERGLQESIVNLKQHEEQAEWRAGVQLYALMYRNHPYSHPSAGTLDSLARVSLNDVRQFHVKSFRGPHMVLAVAGDVTEDHLKSLLERFIADVDPRPSPHGPIPKVIRADKGEFVHLAMDSPQTAIEMGLVAMDREDPDYYPMLVMSQIFGGPGLTSRLNEEIREKRGLTYGVHTVFSPLEAKGPFIITMKTKTESASEAMQLIDKEMLRLASEGVDEAELNDVKRYLTGSFALNFDTLKKQASTWGLIGYYHRGLDYIR